MASLLLAEALLLSTILPSYALQFGGTVSGPTDADVLRPEFESDEAAREAAEEAENTAERRRQKEMWELPPELDSRTGIPLEPGCFVRTPAGCPYHPEFHSAGWKHAAHAERSTEAAIDAAACEVLWKEKVASWCGTVDVEVLFVPQNRSGSGSGSASSRTEATAAAAAPSQRGAASQGIPAPVTNEETAPSEGKGDEQSAARVVVTAPKEPGCFMRTPSGCPNHPGSSSVDWKHDNYAERYTRATVNRSVCEDHRREELSQWCGSADVEVLFVPGVKKAAAAAAAPPPSPRGASAPGEPGSPKREARTELGDVPKEPGCYVRTPTGCTNHPTLRSTAWQYEDIGQARADATSSRSLCEVDQKALVAEWCGVSDVQVIFNQDGDSGAGATSPAGPAGGAGAAGGADATSGADATGEADAEGGVDATGVADATGGAEAARVADVTGGADATRAADGTGGVDVARGADSTVGADARRVAEGTAGAGVPRVAEGTGGADATGGVGAVAGAAAVGGAGATGSTVSATTPTEPGCFVRTPSGCPKAPGFHSQDWKRDDYGEKYGQAAVNRTACEVSRRAEVLAFCGVQDAETLFVPGSAIPRVATVEPGNSSQDPTEPGCYVRTPSGCPNHPVYSSSTWKHEEYGEKAKGAKANRAVCEDERRLHVAHWCGSEDVEALFIQEPGCFVRTPAGCPNHPSFHSELWKHEEYGENNSEAKTDRAVCEVTRREHVVHWCGAESVEMLFVPGWETLRSGEAARRPQDEPELNVSARTTAAATTTTERSLSTYRPLPIVETTPAPFERTTPGPTESPTVSPSALQVDDRNRETVNSAEVQRVSGASVRTTAAATTTERSLSTFRPLPIVETTPVPFERTTPSPTQSPTVSPSTLQVDAPGRETVNSAEVQRVSGASVRTTAAATTTERSLSTYRPLPIVETTPVPFQRTTPSPTESPTASPSTLQVGAPGRETVNSAEAPAGPATTTAPPPGPGAGGASRSAPPEAPEEPGCYLRTPSGCPRVAGAGNASWRHDVHGERETAAKVNQTMCEVERKARLVEWCGSQDVEMLFVPPRAPGCYTRTPTGCPNHPSFNSTAWKHDEYGENHTTAKVSRWRCELSRKLHLAHWCGTNDVRMKFVPPAWDNLIRVDERLSRSGVLPPSEPGCFVRTPSGCPAHPAFSSPVWKHVLFSVAKVHTNRTLCEVERKAYVVEWCGAQDVEVAFVPLPKAGCYVRTPKGCPRHPDSASAVWRRDEHPRGGRATCEWTRKAELQDWCGVEEVHMLYVPKARKS